MLHAKGKKRGMRAFGKILHEAEACAKENPDFKKEIYKALYENLQKMTENIEEELQKKNEEEEKENIENGTDEGN